MVDVMMRSGLMISGGGRTALNQFKEIGDKEEKNQFSVCFLLAANRFTDFWVFFTAPFSSLWLLMKKNKR